MPAKHKKILPTPLNQVWKIRRKSDGLFSSGSSSYPGFSNEGKVFYSEKKLINHINLVNRYHRRYRNGRWQGDPPRPHPYLNCEIVQFKIEEEVSVPFEGYGE